MELPKEFDDRHWWILLSIAGALVTVASAPVSFVPGFAIGLSLLLFGIGQWIDHPILTRMAGGFKVTAYPWRPTVFGVTVTVAGVGMFAFGICRLILR